MDIKELDRKAREKALNDFNASPEMQKLIEKQNKLKQEEEKLKDRIIKLRQQETEKKRKARTHRLVVLGAIIEDAIGMELPKDSEILEAIVRCYAPIIRSEMKNGKLNERLASVRERDEKEAKAKAEQSETE